MRVAGSSFHVRLGTAILLVAASASAQTTAAIVGNVTDPTGAAVAKCAIHIVNEATGQTRDVVAMAPTW